MLRWYYCSTKFFQTLYIYHLAKIESMCALDLVICDLRTRLERCSLWMGDVQFVDGAVPPYLYLVGYPQVLLSDEELVSVHWTDVITTELTLDTREKR